MATNVERAARSERKNNVDWSTFVLRQRASFFFARQHVISGQTVSMRWSTTTTTATDTVTKNKNAFEFYFHPILRKTYANILIMIFNTMHGWNEQAEHKSINTDKMKIDAHNIRFGYWNLLWASVDTYRIRALYYFPHETVNRFMDEIEYTLSLSPAVQKHRCEVV